MRQNILSVMMLVLCLYEANGQNECASLSEGSKLSTLQDYVRTRLDAYRKAYNSASVPYSTQPQSSISYGAYLKVFNLPVSDAGNCGGDIRYLFGTKFYDYLYCCEGPGCMTWYMDIYFPSGPTDVTNYRFVVSPAYSVSINTSNIEEAVDALVQEEEAVEAIFYRPDNNKWGASKGQSLHTRDYYLVFASVEDSGNSSRQSPICLPFDGTQHPSSGPILLDSLPPTTTTAAPITSTSTLTTTTLTTTSTPTNTSPPITTTTPTSTTTTTTTPTPPTPPTSTTTKTQIASTTQPLGAGVTVASASLTLTAALIIFQSII